jgi:membrane protease YdiL (CAAX protease family)
MKQDHWLDNPKNVQKLWRGFLLTLVLTVVAGALVDLHPHFPIEGWFGFYAGYGFVTCLLMIIVAKGLGLLLKRPDNYYDRDNRDE